MKFKTYHRRSLRRNASSCLVEELETRMLLSGNVTASVTSGELYLQGNNLNNSIIVDQLSLSSGQFRVASGDGTTSINGQSGALIFTGVSGISINVCSGNDTVVIQNATVAGSVQVTGASGNQAITLNNVAIDGNFALTNSGGQNSTAIEGSVINGNVTVNAGAGFSSQCGSCWGGSTFADANEIFTLSASSVGNNVAVSNVSGETTTDIEYSSVNNNVTVTDGAGSYGNCGFHCNTAASTAGDLCTLNGSSIGNNMSISNASDGNNTDIESSSINGSVAVSNVVGTSNQCGSSACCSENLADASDAFTLSDSTVGSDVILANISDGATADIEGAAILGGLTINNGVGSYGQGFTSCRGQTSANFGDLLTLSGSTIINNVSIINGSTYNSTDIEGSSIGGNLAVSNGLNLTGQSSNSCCNCCGGFCGGSCGGPSSVYTTDIFTLNGSSVGGNVTVANASGYTNSTIDGSVIGNNATFTNANGVAFFQMSESVIGYNFSYSAGSGSTTVAVTSSLIDNNATITVSSGASITISPTEVIGTLIV